MSAKDMRFHDNAPTKMVAGVNILPDAVKLALSPKGRNRAVIGTVEELRKLSSR